MEQYNLKELKSLSNKQLKGNLFALCLIPFLWFGICFLASAFSVVSTIHNWGWITLHHVVIAVFSAIGSVFMLSFLLNGVFNYGFVENQKAIFNNKRATHENNYEGIKNFWSATSTYLLKWVLMIFWWVFIVPGIIKQFSYTMAMFVQNDDPTKSSSQCIRESAELMNGYKMKWSLYEMYFWGMIFASVLFTLGIGLFWVIPQWMQAKYNYYKRILLIKSNPSV